MVCYAMRLCLQCYVIWCLCIYVGRQTHTYTRHIGMRKELSMKDGWALFTFTHSIITSIECISRLLSKQFQLRLFPFHFVYFLARIIHLCNHFKHLTLTVGNCIFSCYFPFSSRHTTGHHHCFLGNFSFRFCRFVSA